MYTVWSGAMSKNLSKSVQTTVLQVDALYSIIMVEMESGSV